MRAPAIGERWEARRLLALVAAIAVAAAVTLMYAGTAKADGGEVEPVGKNHPTSSSTAPSSSTSSVESSTTSSVESSSTSSIDDSTTTSVDHQTTSTPDVGESTTTPGEGESTTTPGEGESTTTPGDGSSTEPTTPTEPTAPTESTTPGSEPDEVAPTVITTAPGDIDDDELPFTGLDSEVLVGLAILFLGGGAALLAMTRRLEEN